MVWVYIALALPILFLLFLQLLRIHFSLEVRTPATLQGTLGVTFLWFRRELAVDAARAFSSRHDTGGDEDGDGDRPAGEMDSPRGKSAREGDSAESEDGLTDPSFPGQRGAVRVPDSWRTWFSRFANRIRKAALKTALDFHVWRLLLRFTLKSGRRVLGLLHPRLKSMHLGMEDVFDLGRIAAVWSVVRAAVPALSGPAEFGFAEKPFNFRATVAGGFTGLHALWFCLLTLFSFPWLPLGARFAQCWRDPRLNRWQRRVLLP